MAREKVGSDMAQFRLPDGTFDRIKALGISRADFVRDAVLDRLKWAEAGSDPNVPVATAPKRQPASAQPAIRTHTGVVTRPPRKRDWSGEFPAVLDVLPEHAYSVPALAKRLGWTDLKTDKVLRDMEHRGLIRFDRGMVSALEPV